MSCAKYIAFVVLCAIVIKESQAINCFVCTTVLDANCGNLMAGMTPSFNITIQPNCTTCSKSYAPFGVAIRTCSNSNPGCSTPILGVGTCHCQTDLCNGQTLATVSNVLGMLSIIVTTYFVKNIL